MYFRRNGQDKNEIRKLTKGNSSKNNKCRAAVSLHCTSYQLDLSFYEVSSPYLL
jgi:hypothetical protein